MTTKVESLLLGSANLATLGALTLAEGDLLYATGPDDLVQLPKGTAGQFLKMNTGADAPEWVTVASGAITDWVSYVPTFTGFGTVSSSFWTRRVGNTLDVKGIFVVGTPTAVEARISLGFNGVNGGLTIGPAASRELAGYVAQSAAGANMILALAENGFSYMTFGLQSSGGASTVKANGSTLALAGATLYVRASFPISAGLPA